ncbi:MAG: sulfatase-like hydrolase/transferase [Porticoccaceae bacterium]
MKDVMSISNQLPSDDKTISRSLFLRYLGLVVVLILFVGVINFYQILLVAPDTVGMRAFKAALFSSPGFLIDLFWFLGATLALHLLLLAFLWLGTVGWLAAPQMRERQRKITSYFAFVVVCAWIMIVNARYYPNMPSSFVHYNPLMMADATLYVLSGLIVFSFVMSLYRLCKSRLSQMVACSLAVVLVGAFLFPKFVPESQAKVSWAHSDQPNILVIGIDSLRPDETGYFGSDGELTPNIDEFLEHSSVFRSAYTPYARTFPAWMSILTGKEPLNHKGRFNLIDHSYLEPSQTIAWWMREQGYRTVYGFDERRFNNIDTSFGYDEVVGPDPSAMGFVLGQFDHPMINLLTNTVVGKYLFPEMYLNRGRPGNYDPERYNQALLDAITVDRSKPVFLTAHFLLPHFPWFSRDVEELEKFDNPEEPADKFAYQYRMMLKQVDRQVGEFLAQLKASGVLDNAQVFLLSDHGDSFRFEKDQLAPARDDFPFEIETNTRGHATNILSLGQYHVLLAGRSYGNSVFKPGDIDGNASLMDVVPTIFDILGMPVDSKGVDGLSLLSSNKEQRDNRYLFLESGFKTLSVTADDMTEAQLLKEGIKAYTVNDDGKLVVRDVWYDPILRSKHRAVIRGDWQLSIIPGMGEYMVLTNIPEKKWWSLAQYNGEANTQGMFEALCKHYKSDPGFDGNHLCQY